MTKLTGPERKAEMDRAKAIREVVMREGGCKFCLHRVEGFGLYACKSETRTFPKCLQQTITTFTPDEDQLNEVRKNGSR